MRTWTDTLTLFKKVKVKDERGVSNYEDIEVKIVGKLLQSTMHNVSRIESNALTPLVEPKRKFICGTEEEVGAGLKCFVRGDEYLTGRSFKYSTHLEVPLE